MSFEQMVATISERLPELEWKLSQLKQALYMKQFPPGLFKNRIEPTPASCIAEIKDDLNLLATQNNERSAEHLAQRIRQKVNVLVTICHIQKPVSTNIQAPAFLLDKISTNKQWVEDLEALIARLSLQEQALNQRLIQVQAKNLTEQALQIISELGVLRRELTLAQEAYRKATMLEIF